VGGHFFESDGHDDLFDDFLNLEAKDCDEKNDEFDENLELLNVSNGNDHEFAWVQLEHWEDGLD